MARMAVPSRFPDNIDVKTGEEDEQVTYCHWANILRLVSGELKERGVLVKILRHHTTGKFR